MMVVVVTYIGNSYFHVRKDTIFSINNSLACTMVKLKDIVSVL